MKTKSAGFAAVLAFSLFAITTSAEAQISYLRDFPGWIAAVQPDGRIIIDRQDRPGATILSKPSMILFPDVAREFTSKEEVLAWMDEFKNMIADKYSACAPIRDMDLESNGTGLWVQDREKAPHCALLIGGTKDGHMFANLRLDDGLFEQQELPSQRAAQVFISLTVARMQGDEFLKTPGEEVDLAQFVDMIPADHRPEKMVVVQYEKNARTAWGNDRYKAIPLLTKYRASNCSNWDPLFYTPDHLTKVKAKPGAVLEPGSCKLFPWKDDPETGQIVLSDGGEWKPFSEVMGYEIIDAGIKPFAKNEKLQVRFGDLGRMHAVVVDGADIRTLEGGDAIFTTDGTFRANEIALANRPLFLPREMSGRYYVDGHIIVLDLDNGPILVGFGGKIETDGKLTGLFLGGSAYGVYGQ